jgi:hypothetical protein
LPIANFQLSICRRINCSNWQLAIGNRQLAYRQLTLFLREPYSGRSVV